MKREVRGKWAGLAGLLLAGAMALPARAQTPGPMAAEESARTMSLPTGFQATVFAAEPDVVQPIAMTIDPRGRLWVVENTSYPIWKDGQGGHDRILILEDTDGDGRFDRRTIFYDRGANFTGIELGFGGVWICATPNLLFFPDRDRDDRPDAEPQILLDGWSEKAQHNLFNGLKWGPDGWLWGLNGILATSYVGKPGAPDQRRVPLNCGVWRYHPTRRAFEVVAHGTTNPWGLDFDDRGDAYITNCVIAHLFRVIPGSRFERMYGNDFNPYAYELMKSCADHLHWWSGQHWQQSRDTSGIHGKLGGGHAHVGAMIYLGDNWPALYRGTLFTCNIHGRRVNNDRFERDDRSGSVTARHHADFMQAADPWFRGLELKYGPDGGVYLTDWSDQGECHETDSDGAHRENGRIFKITYGAARHEPVDLEGLGDLDLVGFLRHRNEWFARTARRILQERAAAGAELKEAREALRRMLADEQTATIRLRLLWTLWAMDELDDEELIPLLGDRQPEIQAWVVRLLVDEGAPAKMAADALTRLAESATADRPISGFVRLYLVSALGRLATEDRDELAHALARQSPSMSDTNEVLLLWFGLEPLVGINRAWAIELLSGPLHPLLVRFIARRLVAETPEGGLAALLPLLRGTGQEQRSARLELLSGILEGLAGRKQLDMPDQWKETFETLASDPNEQVRQRASALGLLLADPRAEAHLRAVAMDRRAGVQARTEAIAHLVNRRALGFADQLRDLLDDPAVRGAAIRGLAAFNDPAAPALILERYHSFSQAERETAVAALASRKDWARILLAALDQGKIPRRDLSTTIARQIAAFGDPQLTRALEHAWGTLRTTANDKIKLIESYKKIITNGKQPANLQRGRELYVRTCGGCHKLFGEGGDVGPNLTGADRSNLDYLLENVIDPNASVGRDYMATTVLTRDGRLISGIIREQTSSAVVIRTPTETVTLSRDDIESINRSAISLMPEGQLAGLKDQEIRDLFGYLMRRDAVPVAGAR